jgi:hypothetical protein
MDLRAGVLPQPLMGAEGIHSGVIQVAERAEVLLGLGEEGGGVGGHDGNLGWFLTLVGKKQVTEEAKFVGCRHEKASLPVFVF